MTLEIAVPLAMLLVWVVLLTTHHLRAGRLRRQESANIHKRRDVTPPLMRPAE